MMDLLASFAREVLKPMVIDMLGGIVGAFCAVMAMILSAHFLGATPWNILAAVIGMVLGIRVFSRLIALAS